MKKFLYSILNFLLKLLTLLTIIPNFWRLEAFFFGFLLNFFNYRKKIIKKNLEIAFGKKYNIREQQQFIKKFYYYLAYDTCYLFYLLRVNPEKLKQQTHIKSSPEVLQICQKKAPLILLSSHTFAFWIGVVFSNKFMRKSYSYTYYSKEKGVTFVFYLMEKISKRFNSTIISKNKNDTFQMVNCLKNNNCLSILGDLNVKNTKTFLDFFGKKAAFSEGSFRIALKMKIPIVFGSIVEKDKKLILSLIELYNPASKKENPTVEKLAILYKEQVETIIRQNSYYLWSNKRWKTRPPGDTEKIYD